MVKVVRRFSLFDSFNSQSSLPNTARLLTFRVIGKPSFELRVVCMKFSRASLWQSGLLLINASCAGLVITGIGTGQAVVPICSPKVWPDKILIDPFESKEKECLTLTIGPPTVPPYCSR